MKLPRWNTYNFWFCIEAVLVVSTIIVVHASDLRNASDLHKGLHVLLACVICCELIGRNFQYSAAEAEERKKTPLVEQERELVLTFKVGSVIGIGGGVLLFLLFMALRPAIDYPMWLMQGYLFAPVPLYVVRRIYSLRRVRREIRAQSTALRG